MIFFREWLKLNSFSNDLVKELFRGKFSAGIQNQFQDEIQNAVLKFRTWGLDSEQTGHRFNNHNKFNVRLNSQTRNPQDPHLSVHRIKLEVWFRTESKSSRKF